MMRSHSWSRFRRFSRNDSRNLAGMHRGKEGVSSELINKQKQQSRGGSAYRAETWEVATR
jgi:hypothetical protein